MSKSGFAVFGAALVIAIAAFSLISERSGSDATDVRIGYQPLSGSWVFYVANERLPGRDRSFFEEEGLNVEPIRFDSSNAAAEAMLRGDIVTDSATTMTVLFNIEERAPGSLKCFGFQIHTTERFLESFIAGKGSGIASYADLKGKKVGVFPGSLSEAITKQLLKPHLDPETEVTIVRLAPPMQLQALTSGQVDALISYEPTTTLAVSKGVADVVESSPWARHIFQPFPVATYCFTTKFLEDDPETAQKIARAWFKAMDYIRTNPEEAAATISLYTPIEPSMAPMLNQPEQQTVTEVDREAIQRLADLCEEFGLLSEHLDTADLYYVPE